MASWRDMSTPLNQSSSPTTPQPQDAPSAPKSGGWRDMSTPLGQSAPVVAAPASSPATSLTPATTSSSPAPGADPLLAQQPDEGWGGYLLRHLHGASRALDDLATFGYGDKGQGALDQAIGAGPTTAQLKADTNTAYATKNPAVVNYGLKARRPTPWGLVSSRGRHTWAARPRR